MGFFVWALVVAAAFTVTASDDIQVVTTTAAARVAVEPSGHPQQVVVSVLNPSGEPIRELKRQDFAMGAGIRKARILLVEPLPAGNAEPDKYVLTYELLNPVAIEPKSLIFELLTTTTGRSALDKVFFHTGRSEIPDHYVLFKERAEADDFRSDALKGSLNRHLNLLNFVGQALREKPEARIGIVGCNSDSGPEKDNLVLSQLRAEAVKDYLQRIWGIAASRMLIEARNLPAEPSPSDTREGRIENQRVAFVFESDEDQSRIVGPLIAEARNQSAIGIKLDIYARPGLRHGEIHIQGNDRRLRTIPIGSDLQMTFWIPIDDLGRDKISALSSIEAAIWMTDATGQVYEAASDLCHIKTNPRELVREIGHPPYGAVKLEPEAVTVEEITVSDHSPLLTHIYFDTGRAEIPARYHLFRTKSEAQAFDEKTLKGTAEKYRHLLNIIGKRCAERPRAKLTLIGCHSAAGEERGRADLSRRRAEAIRSYLQTAWGIDLQRIQVEARGLPVSAGAADVPEHRIEAQRVEIQADDAVILDPVQSTHVEAMCDTDKLRIIPEVESGLALKSWSIEIFGDDQRLEELRGQEALEASYALALRDLGSLNIGRYKAITAVLGAVDSTGRSLKVQDTSTVRVIRREERIARREGYKVLEKYALIQFDFNRIEIKGGNQRVMDRIVRRLREVPSASVKIVGRMDSIGNFDSNVALSRKRAERIYEMILASGSVAQSRITFEGQGPADPLCDNGLPEGRAFNRSVMVTLEYDQK
jgi:outer membrane protein OmpA-like peptidoglycan-associated protein